MVICTKGLLIEQIIVKQFRKAMKRHLALFIIILLPIFGCMQKNQGDKEKNQTSDLTGIIKSKILKDTADFKLFEVDSAFFYSHGI